GQDVTSEPVGAEPIGRIGRAVERRRVAIDWIKRRKVWRADSQDDDNEQYDAAERAERMPSADAAESAQAAVGPAIAIARRRQSNRAHACAPRIRVRGSSHP